MKTSRKPAHLVSTTQNKPWAKTTVTASSSPGGTADLEVLPDRHQTWEGFGGCFNEIGWDAAGALSRDARRKVVKSLFDKSDGCGFSFCRVPIGASDYGVSWYSCNESAGDFGMKKFSLDRDRKYLIPYIKEAQAFQPNLQLFASPWSPPTWMKNPPVYNHGRFIKEKKYLDSYALYFRKFVEGYRKEGIDICQVHMQNEPIADQKFPSCVWTGEEMRDFIRDHLGPQFRKSNLDCEIWLGTLNTSDYDGYPNTVLSDPKARQYVRGVGFQWDGKYAVQRTVASWPDVRVIQTENECGDGRNSWDYALYVFGLLQHYITNGTVAYVYWNMMLPPGGRSSWGWAQNAMITVDPRTRKVTRNPEYYVMKHFARYIKPGAVRLGLRGPLTGNAVAFENPDGSTVAVVCNPLKQKRRVVVRLGGCAYKAAMPPESFATIVG